MIPFSLLTVMILVAALAWVRPRAYNPQLKEPHDWTRGGNDAS